MSNEPMIQTVMGRDAILADLGDQRAGVQGRNGAIYVLAKTVRNHEDGTPYRYAVAHWGPSEGLVVRVDWKGHHGSRKGVDKVRVVFPFDLGMVDDTVLFGVNGYIAGVSEAGLF